MRCCWVSIFFLLTFAKSDRGANICADQTATVNNGADFEKLHE